MKKILFLVSFLAWHGNTFAGPVSPGVPAVKWIALSIMVLVVFAGIGAKLSLMRKDEGGDQC